MQLNAGVVIFADGSLSRNMTITIDDGFIVDITPNRCPNENVSYAVVTPMFHNGHSHCEYQLLERVLRSSSFFPWVRDVVRIKQQLPRQFWVYSSILGVLTLLKMGFKSSADCSDSGFSTATMSAMGLTGTSYREVNGLSVEHDVPRCQSIIDEVVATDIDINLGLAPHAIYSTCRAVLENVANHRSTLPICIHVDESPDEERFCRYGDGAFAEMFIRRGIDHPSPMSSALQYFDSLGLVTRNTLLVHGCSWDSNEIELVKSRNAAVAICPESNHFLECRLPPAVKLYESDIRTVIGTDSALSCASMSPLKQLKLLMDISADEGFHRWLFRSQVTSGTTDTYDVNVGMPGDFCAYGKGKTVTNGDLWQVVGQFADSVPDVYRGGKRLDFQLDPHLESALGNIVKELASY